MWEGGGHVDSQGAGGGARVGGGCDGLVCGESDDRRQATIAPSREASPTLRAHAGEARTSSPGAASASAAQMVCTPSSPREVSLSTSAVRPCWRRRAAARSPANSVVMGLSCRSRRTSEVVAARGAGVCTAGPTCVCAGGGGGGAAGGPDQGGGRGESTGGGRAPARALASAMPPSAPTREDTILKSSSAGERCTRLQHGGCVRGVCGL